LADANGNDTGVRRDQTAQAVACGAVAPVNHEGCAELAGTWDEAVVPTQLFADLMGCAATLDAEDLVHLP